jgi:hypothetical protein
VVPLMQTFHTSRSAPARYDTSTIDYAVLPALYNSEPESSSSDIIRVPLLPDTHFLPIGVETHAPEQADTPLAAPEIVVIAADPSRVMPAALTEVEGMGVDGVELRFMHDDAAADDAESQGMLKDLWKGLVDDVFGEKTPKPAL